MMNITKENKMIVYADDTTVLVKGRNLTETKQHCNDILQRFYDYFCLNKLSVYCVLLMLLCSNNDIMITNPTTFSWGSN